MHSEYQDSYEEYTGKNNVNNTLNNPDVDCEDNYIPSSSHDASDLFNPSSGDVDNY